MDNLEEMDKFLERYSFPKLNKKETENMNRPITSTETESVIQKLPANRSPGPRACSVFSRHNWTQNPQYTLIHDSNHSASLSPCHSISKLEKGDQVSCFLSSLPKIFNTYISIMQVCVYVHPYIWIDPHLILNNGSVTHILPFTWLFALYQYISDMWYI